MSIEAELTAVVRDPGKVRAALAARAQAEHSVYADTYFDRPDHSMDRDGYELRIRTITTEGNTRTIVTYKEPAADKASGSKPEHETPIGDAAVLRTMFTGLGLVELISLQKQCDNYRFTVAGRDILATLVTIAELGDRMFIEVETIADDETLADALGTIRDILTELGVPEADAVTESYTDMVAQARR